MYEIRTCVRDCKTRLDRIPTSRVDCRLGGIVESITLRSPKAAVDDARPVRGFGLRDNPIDARNDVRVRSTSGVAENLDTN